MKKLTYLEIKILKAIAEVHPYSFSDCEYIYRECKSFNKTIEILEMARREAKSIQSILDVAGV